MTKRRKPRRLEPTTTSTFKPWKVAAYTDIHFSAKTLDRGLRVLARVREGAAVAGIKTVICLGDFWDQRGVLSVRQLDAVFDELERFNVAGLTMIFIPGNHDQVTVDGAIHGVRPFDAFPHVRVFTDLKIVPEYGVAYIPWREDPAEQAAMFEKVPAGFTVFAHCEIKGATTNSSHVADGRVEPHHMAHLRAVYAGHYHKRQQLGNAWYVGSPFEMDFGERDWPHGVAVLASDRDPDFIDWDDFPRHYRLTYPDDFAPALPGSPPRPLDLIQTDDVVEVYAPRETLHDATFLAAVEGVVASDVRRLPVAEDEATGAPAAALSLDAAIDAYVDAATEDEEARVALKSVGRAVLGEVPDTAAVVPLGNLVRPMYVTVRDFCALNGEVTLDLSDIGTMLLEGPMGVGKTSIFDAISWVLYGVTSPRKAGSSGSTLRADDVIHDDADSTEGMVALDVDGTEVIVKRSKHRGKGAKLTVTGVAAPGISDTQELVTKAVGLPYELWRTCVSLGQGDVSNFVTDADKKRKELLSRAFQLGACPPAVKLIRKKLAPIAAEVATLDVQISQESTRIETLASMDFAAEAKRWQEQKDATAEGVKAQIETCKAQIEEFDRHLATEPQWIETRDKLAAYIDERTSHLVKSDHGARTGKIHQEMGRLQAERGLQAAKMQAARKRHSTIQGAISSGISICDVCGQALSQDVKDQLLDDLEREIRSIEGQTRSFDLEISTLQTKLGELTSHGTAEQAAVQDALKDTREKLSQCERGLNAIAQVKANKERTIAQWHAITSQAEKMSKAENPFAQKAKEATAQLLASRQILKEAQGKKVSREAEGAALRFWEKGFGPKGLPVLVLRTALHELEMYANRFLSKLMGGRVHTRLEMVEDDLRIDFFEQSGSGAPKERTLHMLSGGMRRCAQLAFVPFALSELVFSRTGVRVPLLLVDELTTHLDPATKPLVCAVLKELGRESVLVIDHDQGVAGEFDSVLTLASYAGGVTLERR